MPSITMESVKMSKEKNDFFYGPCVEYCSWKQPGTWAAYHDFIR